jgi:2-amino-4-hydroxy-6-hydroxymethyldihydropteridine diphosphokinase
MSTVYLGLGTNLGDKEQNLHQAIDKIQERVGKILSLSAFYNSAPWGYISDNMFVNAVVCISTTFSPQKVLNITQEIEKELGRKEKSIDASYSDRVIDIDILLYDSVILSTDNLTIPHPLMIKRLFVMDPLAEIAPDMVVPGVNKTVMAIRNELK